MTGIRGIRSPKTAIANLDPATRERLLTEALTMVAELTQDVWPELVNDLGCWYGGCDVRAVFTDRGIALEFQF